MNSPQNNPDVSYVFALVYEDPNDYIYEYNDFRREVLGIYETREQAQSDLDLIEDQANYSIERWEDIVPF